MRDLNDIENKQAGSLSNDAAKFLHEKRGIPPQISERFVETDPKFPHEVLFQFHDQSGQLLYRKRMKLTADGKRDSSEHPRRDKSGVTTVPFNAPCLDARPSELAIFEGEFDCLSALTAGVDHSISVPDGAPSKFGEGAIIPSEDAKFAWLWGADDSLRPEYARADKIVLAVDADAPGAILRDELAIRLGRDRCYFVEWPDGCKDANDVLVKCGATALRHCIEQAKPLIPDQTEWVKNLKFEEMPQGRSVGIPGFDYNCRVIDGDFVTIVGLPNAGKSVLSRIFASGLAFYHNQPGTILQFEDRDSAVVESLKQYYIGRKFEAGQVVSPELKAEAEEWVGSMFRMQPFQLAHSEKRDLDWLLATIRQDVTRHGIKWFMIDPWNQLAHSWNQGRMNEVQYMEDAFRQINALRKELGVTIIICAHPDKTNATSKTFEDFNLYHVSGGQHWNNASDIGIVLARKNPNDPNDTTMQLKTCKCRQQSHRGFPGGGEWQLVQNGMLLKHRMTGMGDDLKPVMKQPQHEAA